MLMFEAFLRNVMEQGNTQHDSRPPHPRPLDSLAQRLHLPQLQRLLREQRALGWETFHLTSPKQGETSVPFEDVDGLRFYRTPCSNQASLARIANRQGICT